MACECPARQKAPAGAFSVDVRPSIVNWRLAVEDDEHLLAVVVEVSADSALRLDVSAVQKNKLVSRL